MAAEVQVRCHIPRVPQMSQSIPGKPVFPALSRLSSRGWTHTTVARGKPSLSRYLRNCSCSPFENHASKPTSEWNSTKRGSWEMTLSAAHKNKMKLPTLSASWRSTGDICHESNLDHKSQVPCLSPPSPPCALATSCC